MSESFVQLPPDSTGRKLRTRQRTISAESVEEQYVLQASSETWIAYANAVAFAANKQHLSVLNAAGSGVIVKLRKLFAVNLQTATVTGIVLRFDLKKATTHSVGTPLVPETMDSANPVLPAGVTVRTGATVTEGNLVFPWITSSEEETAVPALSKSLFQQSINILAEGPEIQEWTLREGEGMTVKQITSSVIGSFGWLLVFTVE